MPGHILIVDDDPSIVNLLNENLTAEGYTVVSGYDGQAAVELAQSEHPGLIILDLNMPGTGGMQAFEQLRNIPDCKAIPVIFLTGDASKEIAPASELNVTKIKKPFDLDELNALVARLIKKK